MWKKPNNQVQWTNFSTNCVNHENEIIKEGMISSFYESFKKDLEEEMKFRLSITMDKILLVDTREHFRGRPSRIKGVRKVSRKHGNHSLSCSVPLPHLVRGRDRRSKLG